MPKRYLLTAGAFLLTLLLYMDRAFASASAMLAIIYLYDFELNVIWPTV